MKKPKPVTIHLADHLKVGDRVAAFHEMRTPGGSYAEYAVAWAYTTFHLPEKTSFEGEFV
jgi:NADPH:quinone reductase-like Zn-dependent oxidoreductase